MALTRIILGAPLGALRPRDQGTDMVTILGIDPGLAILGFGAIACPAASGGEGAEAIARQMPIEPLDYGIIQTPAHTPLGDRLCTLYGDLNDLLDAIAPDLVALEKLFFYRMGNTIAVAQARGVTLLAIAQRQLPLVEFTPAQVKQALTGHGNAPKADVQAAVARELALDHLPKPDDAADALAVAIAAWFST